MPSLLISRLASSTRASYPWTGAPRPPRDSSSAVKRVTSQGVALVPRWRRLGGSFGSYLVPPLAEGSPAHVFGPGCDEVLCSPVGKNVGGFVLLPLEVCLPAAIGQPRAAAGFLLRPLPPGLGLSGRLLILLFAVDTSWSSRV